MGEFYDQLETRSNSERITSQFQQLREQIIFAQTHTHAFSAALAGVEAGDVIDHAALATLPIMRKSDLIDKQAAEPPFGGMATQATTHYQRVFASPGPIYEPEGSGVDYWRLARALFAAGFRADDLVYNTFSYHFTPAGSMLESGAHTLGCAVFPAGPGQTELQIQTINDLQPSAYVGTPSFLRMLIDKSRQQGRPIDCFNKALVSGEALPPSLREVIAADGIAIYQCYATADLGLIAYESPALNGMIVDEGVIVEIVRPGTGDPVDNGEVGEVVVTLLHNRCYPLIRFATGDLSAFTDTPGSCGRSNQCIKGWMGRADQTTKVRGMFVHPEQIDKVVKRHSDIGKARLVVSRENNNDVMTLYCESDTENPELIDAVVHTLRDICKLRGTVELLKPGVLVNDGKVIDDTRALER